MYKRPLIPTIRIFKEKPKAWNAEEKRDKCFREKLEKVYNKRLKINILQLEKYHFMIDKVKRRNLIKEKMELEKRREEAFLDYMEKVKMVVNTTSYQFLLKSLEHDDDDSLSKYEVEIDREKEREDNTKEDNNKEVKHMEINPPREIYDFWRVVLKCKSFVDSVD